MRFKE